jgi:hypothetical protein
MKRFLTLTTLAVVALGVPAGKAAADAFGLFYCPLYCDKRCGAFVIQKNAFTQVPNCCPGPCWAPGCNPTGPQHPLGPYGFHGPQSFGVGGFAGGVDGGGDSYHVRRLFSKKWTRCAGCGGGDGGEYVDGHGGYEGPVGFDGHAGGPVGPGGPGFHAGAAPFGGYTGAPYYAGNFNVPQYPMAAGQPTAYPSYGVAPSMPGWGGYGYGSYPVSMPMYNPGVWKGNGAPAGR